MVLYRGSYVNFFNTLGKKGGFLLSAILLTVWIPLGSAPRCMTLAYASFASYFEAFPPLWIFALFYSALVFLSIARRLAVLDILGKVITPLLLICIGLIFFKGVISLPEADPAEFTGSFFLLGLSEGYNTMDLIASFFFSASVIHLLTQENKGSLAKTLPLVFKSSVLGISILGSVYVCLILLSAHFAPFLQGIPKDQILATLAQHILGPVWSVAAIAAIFLACFSTSIALILAYTDFLHEEIFLQKINPNAAMALALAVSFVMSLFGLQGITTVTAPVLKLGYPILIGLIAYNLGKMAFQKRFSLDKTRSFAAE
jgi:LIVCS family branched-chain amino acid:cation transporter